jgi:hypothetical protein
MLHIAKSIDLISSKKCPIFPSPSIQTSVGLLENKNGSGIVMTCVNAETLRNSLETDLRPQRLVETPLVVIDDVAPLAPTRGFDFFIRSRELAPTLKFLLVSEGGHNSPPDDAWAYMADMLLRVGVEQTVAGYATRFGEVVKSRYIRFPLGRTPFSIMSLLHRSPLPPAIIEVVSQINQKLILSLQSDPETLYDLPSRAFEELIAELLASFGWKVSLTAATRDGGYDIWGIAKNLAGVASHWLVECKRYRRDRVVGINLIRELYAVKAEKHVGNAMIATTSFFSRDVKKFGRSHYDLALADFNRITGWLGSYRLNSSGTLYIRDANIIGPDKI